MLESEETREQRQIREANEAITKLRTACICMLTMMRELIADGGGHYSEGAARRDADHLKTVLDETEKYDTVARL